MYDNDNDNDNANVDDIDIDIDINTLWTQRLRARLLWFQREKALQAIRDVYGARHPAICDIRDISTDIDDTGM